MAHTAWIWLLAVFQCVGLFVCPNDSRSTCPGNNPTFTREWSHLLYEPAGIDPRIRSPPVDCVLFSLYPNDSAKVTFDSKTVFKFADNILVVGLTQKNYKLAYLEDVGPWGSDQMVSEKQSTPKPPRPRRCWWTLGRSRCPCGLGEHIQVCHDHGEHITHLGIVVEKAGQWMDHLRRLKKHLVSAEHFNPGFWLTEWTYFHI